MWSAFALLLLPVCLPLTSVHLSAQQTGSVAGRVLASSGEPVTDAEVSVVGTRLRTDVDREGTFLIDHVPVGEVLLRVNSPRHGSAAERVSVSAGERVEVELAVGPPLRMEEVVVTVSPEARGLSEVYQAVDVLAGRELSERLQPSLGETLAQESGVSSTYFGPGASRPVIRGLGGDRIRILERGLGAGDASNTSPDHAVTIEPALAERIEIVRGPATLLYGGSAVGGVVNVIGSRMPDERLDRPVSGWLELRGGTVAEERTGAAALNGGLGRLAWHADAFARETEEYRIPGEAEVSHHDSDEESVLEEHASEESRSGVLENSAIEASGGSLGLAYVAETGFVGLSVSGLDQTYGVPGHGPHSEGAEEEAADGADDPEEESLRLDLEHRRMDVEARLDSRLAFVSGVKGRFGLADYEDVELEGESVGTRTTSESWEGRLEAAHRPRGALSGSVGVQAARRDFAKVGREAFVPPSETESWGVFALEELASGKVTYQVGARYERQEVTPRDADAGRRSFDGLSLSTGAVWSPRDDYSFSLALSRAVKLPTAEELFSNGFHAPTNAIELGDPDLAGETSLGADVTFRKLSGGLSGEINLFANRFDDFIFLRSTGEERDGLRVLEYVQEDAEFRGGEVDVDLELLRSPSHRLGLRLAADYVRAELRSTGEPGPRIPPLRYGPALRYEGKALSASLGFRRVDAQERVAEFEETTDGHTLLNVTLGYRFSFGGALHDVLLRGTNLTDTEARNHVSFLKDLAPLPGRDVSLSYRLTF